MKFHEACGDYNCHAVFSMSIEGTFEIEFLGTIMNSIMAELEIWRKNHRHNHLVVQGEQNQ